jgi:FAD synthase
MIKIIDLSSMQSIRLGEKDASVLCLGKFDGVHIAHAELTRRTVLLGNRLSDEARDGARIRRGAFFFADHTGERLGKDKGALLTGVDDKLALFGDMGLDIAVIAEFDEIMNMTPEQFVREVLIEKCASVGAVCGYNFRFGRGGEGDAHRLCSLMGESRCEIVGEIKIDGDEVSSSAVRAALKEGDVERAARLLGRNFSTWARIERVCDGFFEVMLDAAIAAPREDTYEVRVTGDGESFFARAELFALDGRVLGKIFCDTVPQGEKLKIEFIEKI